MIAATEKGRPMDWLTFISNMTAALAWPVVAALIAFRYRSELRQILIATRKLKLGPIEAELFEIRSEDLRALADALPRGHASTPSDRGPNEGPRTEEPRPDGSPVDQLVVDLERIGDEGRRTTFYALAIRTAWNVIEDAVRGCADEMALNATPSFVTVILALRNHGCLDQGQFAVLRSLYEYRMDVAGTTIGISEHAMTNFIEACVAALRSLPLKTLPERGRAASLRATSLGAELPRTDILGGRRRGIEGL